MCGAVLIAASLTVDEYHNCKPRLACEIATVLPLTFISPKGYDCVGGALTGTFCAFIAYRKTFAAIWDFRFNHVLLPRMCKRRHSSQALFTNTCCVQQAPPPSSIDTRPREPFLNSATAYRNLCCTDLLPMKASSLLILVETLSHRVRLYRWLARPRGVCRCPF